MKIDNFFFSALFCLVLASCNKDEVIEPDSPTDNRRPITNLSSAFQDMVYEYTPAPGQFINELKTGGFTGEETTPDAACAYALERLDQMRFVSLGAFGGYIVIGFDHSVVNLGTGYDFSIMGNAFNAKRGSSNEPGIVWVMQDTNGNGKPDDTWYQLAGSEYDAPTTVHDYTVTYRRPAADRMPVEWVDSDGATGTIDYLPAYHNQASYYPAWITADSYTLSGTRLEPRSEYDEDTGEWANNAYPWGYADNVGSDCIDKGIEDGEAQAVGFKISNAVDASGKSVTLPYIDFVKVQTAVMAKCGRIGENSCEVLSFHDLNPALQSD